MGFEKLKKTLQEQAAEAERQRSRAAGERDAFAAALPGLIESAIKPAMEALHKLISATGNPTAKVTYGEEMVSPIAATTYHHGHAVSTAIATFDCSYTATDGAYAVMIGSAPIHVIASGATISLIAWDASGYRYVQCASLALREITQDKIESALGQIVGNMRKGASPDAT